LLVPSMDELTKAVDSKYALVVAAAKRARQLVDSKRSLVMSGAKKPVSVALEELREGRLKLERGGSGIK